MAGKIINKNLGKKQLTDDSNRYAKDKKSQKVIEYLYKAL